MVVVVMMMMMVGGGAAWWQSLRAAKILVFANKQDLKGAMTSAELSDALNLHAVKDHDWHIQACCALTGEGYAPSPLFLSLRRSSCALSNHLVWSCVPCVCVCACVCACVRVCAVCAVCRAHGRLFAGMDWLAQQIKG
jgi:hypothetical protein